MVFDPKGCQQNLRDIYIAYKSSKKGSLYESDQNYGIILNVLMCVEELTQQSILEINGNTAECNCCHMEWWIFLYILYIISLLLPVL